MMHAQCHDYVHLIQSLLYVPSPAKKLVTIIKLEMEDGSHLHIKTRKFLLFVQFFTFLPGIVSVNSLPFLLRVYKEHTIIRVRLAWCLFKVPTCMHTCSMYTSNVNTQDDGACTIMIMYRII